VPLRLRPAPELARADLHMSDPDAEARLPYGWFPAEHVDGRSYRWAGPRAAALVRLDEPVRRLHLDYGHAPVDIGPIDVSIRRIDSADPCGTVWRASLPWQYIARSVENHPLWLPAGDYEVAFSASRGWSDPPLETRSLAFALASFAFEQRYEIPSGGIAMESPHSEQQLVQGWFEQEQSPTRSYRWASGSAGAVVRLDEPARGVRFVYRLPPVSIGRLRVAISKLGEPGEVASYPGELASVRIDWHDADWHEAFFELDLTPGDYLLSFATETAWSNPDQRDPSLWAENRSLGFALASLTFS
jgi:hypothetical protein